MKKKRSRTHNDATLEAHPGGLAPFIHTQRAARANYYKRGGMSQLLTGYIEERQNWAKQVQLLHPHLEHFSALVYYHVRALCRIWQMRAW